MRKGRKPTNKGTIKISFGKPRKDFLEKKAIRANFGICTSINYIKKS